MIIAIDGPAASGKSTTAKKVSFTHLDTGAMYRAVTLFFLDNKTVLSDPDQIQYAVNLIRLKFLKDQILLMNDVDVSAEIRTGRVTEFVSEVSALQQVREKMVYLQREIAKFQDVVVEGRDIGTHVFPDAKFKFFIVADVEERARRRYDELKNKFGDINFNDVLLDLKGRDKKDASRKISPLKKAEDAIVIDTTSLTIDEQVDEIIDIINNKIHNRS
jgi:cytidylate kinase